MSEQQSGKSGVDPLPLPSHVGIALGAVLVEMEATFPGLVRRALKRLERDSSQATVRRIRGPSVDAETRRALSEAARWMAVIAMFSDAEHGPLATRQKRRKKR